eukprot:500875-Amphidinium_carterae.1
MQPSSRLMQDIWWRDLARVDHQLRALEIEYFHTHSTLNLCHKRTRVLRLTLRVAALQVHCSMMAT